MYSFLTALGIITAAHHTHIEVVHCMDALLFLDVVYLSRYAATTAKQHLSCKKFDLVNTFSFLQSTYRYLNTVFQVVT